MICCKLAVLLVSSIFRKLVLYFFLSKKSEEDSFLQMMKMRHKIEREENIGEEVGMSKNKEVAKRNTKLAEANKKFGMLHGLSSLANLLSFGGLVMHSWYLASHLLL